MGLARWGMVAALASVPAAGLAQDAGERLAAPPLSGFVVGYQAANAQQSIREEVPRGETVERWTRMVTTQRFTGLAARTTPGAYARTITDSVPRVCPGARISPVSGLLVSGHPSVRFQVDCPRNGQGQPETFVLLAIAGRSDMHVKQVAFRGPHGAADLAWGRSFLDRTVLCGPRDRQAECR